MSKNAVRTIFAVAAATALMMSLISPAGAGHGEHENGRPVSSSSNNGNGNGNSGNNGNGGDNNGGGGGGDNDLTKVCPDPDENKENGSELASWGGAEATPGYYIKYCAKAGSGVNDNCGPVLGGNQSTVEVTRADIEALCPGKQISHFSWWQVAKTNTSTPTTPEQESTTTTTQPVEEEVLDAVETAPTAVLAAGTPVFTG